MLKMPDLPISKRNKNNLPLQTLRLKAIQPTHLRHDNMRIMPKKGTLHVRNSKNSPLHKLQPHQLNSHQQYSIVITIVKQLIFLSDS